MTNKAKIYVVDPDTAGRQLIANTLRKVGYTVAEWPAINQVDVKEGCDIVILDPNIEGTTPKTAIAALRAHNDLLNTSLIICTVMDDDQVIIDCLDAGADDYIVKPISPATLVARVHSLMRRRSTYPMAQ